MNLEYNAQLAEVELRYKSHIPMCERVQLSSSVAVNNYLKHIYDPEKIEHCEFFMIILLNRANHVLGWSKLSEGGVSGTVVDLKKLFQLAIKCNASSIIMSHNHPSGQLEPSEQDKHITKQVKEAGKLLDVSLLDHVIISPEGYFSFADRGLV